MRTLPAAYLNAAKAAGRYPNCYALIGSGNSTLKIDGKDALISAHIVLGDTAKPAYFEVGRAISGSATVVVDRRRIADESQIVSGAKIEIYAEFDQPNGTAIADNIIATMYISGYDNQNTDFGYITAVDKLVYTGGDFNPDNLTYPLSMEDMLTEAFDQSGESGVILTLPCNPNINSAPYKAEEPVADGMSGDPYTCREVIAKIAGLQMSDVFIDATGNPKVYAYGSFITTAIADNMILERRVGSENFEITLVHVYHTEERMPKDTAHYEHLAYNPRFEDMDEIGSGSAWWDEIVARAHIFVNHEWATAQVTFSGVGELELGDFVECGSDAVPLFISGIEYNFEHSQFTETVYSFAYSLEDYFAAPAYTTVVSTDVKKTGGGVGEFVNDEENSERFNDYTNNASTGQYNHVEGKNNTATGASAATSSVLHVEGENNTVSGYCVHCEGQHNTVTNANKTFVSGDNHTVNGASQSAVLGGSGSTISGTDNIVGGSSHTVSGNGNAVFGNYNRLSSTYYNFVSGQSNEVTGSYNDVSGDNNTVSDSYNAVSGSTNEVRKEGCVVGGLRNKAYNSRVTVFGRDNTNAGVDALVFGDTNTNSGNTSIVGGNTNTNTAKDAHVVGHNNTNLQRGAMMCGEGGTNTNHYISVTYGNSEIFYVGTNGACYAAGGYTSPAADYAEYFEWADGNPKNEDRRGMLVQLVGDKIAPAHGTDILGIISACPSVVGNAFPEHWRGKYKRDVFGAYVLDADGEKQLSEDYDETREYIPRSERPEWSPVGILGQLVIRDNGKCQPGGYVEARQGIGVPTFTETNIRCIKRIDEKHCKVLIK